jgi:mannitol operon repressor
MSEQQVRSEQMLILTNELSRESERAAALLAAGYLDHLLGEFLATHMVVAQSQVEEMLYKNGNGPLGTFSARMDLAYCLGLLSVDEHRDLNLIRKIRNDFAHRLTGQSFTTPSIASRCRELKGSQVDGQPPSAREQFTKASIRLMIDLIVRVESNQQRDKHEL